MKHYTFIMFLHRLTFYKKWPVYGLNFGNMKHLLIVLLILLGFSGFGQNRFPSVDSAKNYVLRYIKNSAVESFTNWRMQNVTYGTLELLDSIAVDGSLDSIYKSGDTLKYSLGGVVYTVGTFGGSGNLQQVLNIGRTANVGDSSVILLAGITDNILEFAEAAQEVVIGRIRFADSSTVYESINSSGNKQTTYGLNKITNQNLRASTINLPDSSGTLTERVRINSVTYNTASNGVVDLGNTDTATVVKAYVTNAEAVTITKGQVVYIFGASGDRAAVKLAKNTSDTFSSKTLGIVRNDILAGQAGWITTQGQVGGINLGAYTAGDILWLDSVPGGFTKVRPQAPYHGVFVGVVERANAGNGLIYVKPQNGQELGELHDTKITSPTNNQVLAYTAASDIWENKTIENILQFDTIPLAAFGAGSGAAGDTLAFSTSAVYGSFYNAGNDTLIITQMRAGVLGTSPSITTEVYWNDSLNITAGATILVTGGTSVTGTIGATNVTSFTNNKIPPNVWVFVRTSAVATKPTYFTLTLLGYRKRQ
jgi:ribosomal protein S8E